MNMLILTALNSVCNFSCILLQYRFNEALDNGDLAMVCEYGLFWMIFITLNFVTVVGLFYQIWRDNFASMKTRAE